MAKSLVSKPVESNPGGANMLPALFDQPGGPVGDYIGPQFVRSPYVSFVSTRSPSFGRLSVSIPDLEDGDPVLMLPEPARPVKLAPFRFYLLNYFQHFSEVSSDGMILRTSFDPQAAAADGALKDHIETLLLVVHGDKITPARCTFKTTKAAAAHTAIAAMKEAATPEWSGRSPEHAASLVAPKPWMRFTATVRLKRGTGRASGFAYVAANAIINPTGAADWTALAAALKDDAFLRMSNAILESFNLRVAEIRSKS